MGTSQPSIEEWVPSTRVGRLVKEGKIISLHEIFENNMKIMEPEIVDYLMPDLKHEVVNISIVQKQTDAGEMTRFKTLVIVGNYDGFVGLGAAKARQVRFAIQKALQQAKLNIIPVKRGCGSWECMCGNPHSIPYIVKGKSGSVEVTLKPAPRGTGLVIGDVGKIVLRYAGISDIWSTTRGRTRTTYNFAFAVYNALKETFKFVTPKDWTRE